MKGRFESYKGKLPYAFVSYSHKDSDRVYPIIEALNNEGYRLWYDEGIAPTEEWRGVINEHIRDCSLFVLFVTENSMDSHEVIKECTYAINLHKKLHIIYLERVPEEAISSNLIADFTNSQRVHAYEIHSSVLDRKLREPMGICRDSEVIAEMPVISEKMAEPSGIITSNDSDGSAIVRAWKQANPSVAGAAVCVALILLVAVVYIVLMSVAAENSDMFRNGKGLLAGSMIIIQCIFTSIPLIWWLGKIIKTKKSLNEQTIKYRFWLGNTSALFALLLGFAWMTVALIVYQQGYFVHGYGEGMDYDLNIDSIKQDFNLIFNDGWESINVIIFFNVIRMLLIVISRCKVQKSLNRNKKIGKAPFVLFCIFAFLTAIRIICCIIVLALDLSNFSRHLGGFFAPEFQDFPAFEDGIICDFYLMIFTNSFAICNLSVLLAHEISVFRFVRSIADQQNQ